MSEISDESHGLRAGIRYTEGDEEEGEYREPPPHMKALALFNGFEYRRRSSGMWVLEP